MKHPIHGTLGHTGTAENLKTYCFNVTPNFEEQRLRLG